MLTSDTLKDLTGISVLTLALLLVHEIPQEDAFCKLEMSHFPGSEQTGFCRQWGSTNSPALIWVSSLHIMSVIPALLESVRFWPLPPLAWKCSTLPMHAFAQVTEIRNEYPRLFFFFMVQLD